MKEPILARAARLLASAALFLAVMVLIGWTFRIDPLVRFKAEWASCKPWTAIVIALLAMAMLRANPSLDAKPRYGWIIAAGLLILVQLLWMVGLMPDGWPNLLFAACR